jgi:hypothetical protein
VLDRDLLQESEPSVMPTDATVVRTELKIDGVYPLSAYAVGLFRLYDDAEAFSDQRFGWQFLCQMEVMQRRYGDRQVRQEDIEPFHQLSGAMAAHFRARYDPDTFAKRWPSALLANWLSAREALEGFENAAEPCSE